MGPVGQQTETPILIYLLHFDSPVRGKRHYLGSTEHTNLRTRLRRHQLGSGSNLTKKAAQLEIGFTLAGLWKVTDRSIEKKIKVAKHYDKKCCICLTGTENPTLFADVLYYPPNAPKNGDNVLTWR